MINKHLAVVHHHLYHAKGIEAYSASGGNIHLIRHDGKGFWGSLWNGVKSVGKFVAPVLLNAGKSAVNSVLSGESGVGDALKNFGKNALGGVASSVANKLSIVPHKEQAVPPATPAQVADLGGKIHRSRPRFS